MVLRLGFVINPVAGIGGPAALKGSDGVVEQAARAGFGPSAADKAQRFLRRLRQADRGRHVRIFAAPGVMGSGVAREAGWKVGTLGAETFVDDAFATTALDTKDAGREAVAAEMDLIVFVGGDGTARDLAAAVDGARPILGVPAGVKMFSDCFAETPEAAADLVATLAAPPFEEGGAIDTFDADIMDLDEEAYRDGVMQVRHHATARVPRSPRVQAAKCPACPQDGLDEALAEIRFRMEDQQGALFVIGAGSTLLALKAGLGVQGSLLGVDVVEHHEGASGWRVLAADVDRRSLDVAVEQATRAGRAVVLVLSPLGGQGFVIGRGTAQISAAVVRAALPDRLWLVATSGKLATVADQTLRVDSGDPELDVAFPRHLRVVVGLARERLLRVSTGSG